MIRKATLDDIGSLAVLMGVLGYPATVVEMEKRFTKIHSNPLYNTKVAEIEGTVVGMIGMMLGFHYESNGNYVRIVALVVDSACRKQGIGAALITAAEEWALEQGANKLVLNSGNRKERNDAHQFYKNKGFEGKATGFYKVLELN